MGKSNFCIVIPIYEQELDITEKLSLKQLINITNNKYDIYFIIPKGFDTKNYYEITGKSKNIKEKSFDKHYFESMKDYSSLCLSYDFYNSFSKYDYMYIYQLDCYLFKDELQLWVDKGYDYIGGPILSSLSGWADQNKPWKPIVGNGGFSLRKISKFKEITDSNGEFRTYYKITDDLLKGIEFEDKYFCKFVYSKYEFNIPLWTEAMFFAFDMNVDVYYERIGFKGFPMGCHAWPKNIRYWINHCEEMNQQDIIDFCEEKYKEYFELYYKNFEEKRKILIEKELEKNKNKEN